MSWFHLTANLRSSIKQCFWTNIKHYNFWLFPLPLDILLSSLLVPKPVKLIKIDLIFFWLITVVIRYTKMSVNRGTYFLFVDCNHFTLSNSTFSLYISPNLHFKLSILFSHLELGKLSEIISQKAFSCSNMNLRFFKLLIDKL